MIIERRYEREILDGLLPLLGVFYEPETQVMTKKGSYLIANGIKEIVQKGIIVPVFPFADYALQQTTQVKVKHTGRIKAIIAEASDVEDMQERLAAYLAKYTANPDNLKTENHLNNEQGNSES